MDSYSVDHEYLQIRRKEFDLSEIRLKNQLLAKGEPRALADAIVQKSTDFHNAKHQYLTMREVFQERDYRVRKRASELGLNLTRPTAGVYHPDLSSIQQRRAVMDNLTTQIVQWMHTAGVDPYHRLTIHQSIQDWDIGRRDELRFIEFLKEKLSIVTIWKNKID